MKQHLFLVTVHYYGTKKIRYNGKIRYKCCKNDLFIVDQQSEHSGTSESKIEKSHHLFTKDRDSHNSRRRVSSEIDRT